LSLIFPYLCDIMKWKLFVSIVAFLVALQALQAQSFGQNQKNMPGPAKTGIKPQVHLSLGTSFTTFYPGLSGFSSWVAPEISMPVGKKWTLTAGMAYSNFVMSGAPEIAGFGQTVQNYGTVYVQGRYQVNDKLSITAAGYKSFNLAPQRPQQKVNPRAIDFSNSGAMVNINYKVNDHFHINAAFSMQQRHYNPFMPYGYGDYNSGFYGSPFPPYFYPQR